VRAVSDLHVPQRPGWECRACGHEWPCPVARRCLQAEYAVEPVNVALYAASQFSAASVDLPGESAGEMYVRFVGWLRD
jgi:hypothetical protein